MINLNTLAARLHLSRTYAGRVFKDATGENFNDYLNKRRVDRAKELLAEPKLTIDEIAHQTGFSYTNYFIRVFKSIEGVMPGTYRKNVLYIK